MTQSIRIPMTDPREQINRLIEAAEQAAYQKGWHDALDAVAASAERLRANETTEAAPRRRGGRPPSPAMKVVEDCIKATPGMSGVQVVKAAQSVDAAIRERTVRTNLRRLKLKQKILKRGDLWYPRKPADIPHENGDDMLLLAH